MNKTLNPKPETPNWQSIMAQFLSNTSIPLWFVELRVIFMN